MEATFIKGLKPSLKAAVRVMNPEGLNNAMELVVSIEDNQLYEGNMQSKGVAAIVRQTTSKGDNFRRMTKSEIQDRKAKGLCFRSDSYQIAGDHGSKSGIDCQSSQWLISDPDSSLFPFDFFLLEYGAVAMTTSIVLSIEDKLNYLEQPLPPAPVAPAGQQVAPEILAAHTAWVKGSKEIVGLMLMTMDSEIQQNLENLHAYDMLQELKTLFAQQAEQELLQTTRDFHSCKQEEGQSLARISEKMKAIFDNLELWAPRDTGLCLKFLIF
ncbi:hypothetical protein Tco_0529697 [Tanacetum coccineum]